MVADQDLRVQGVSLPDVSDYRDPVPAGQWSQFFAALSRQVQLVGISRPSISRAAHYANLARSAHPNREAWLARAGFNLGHVTKLNAALASDLESRRGSYDLIVQLQTLCSPRSRWVDAPYVIYTDNTMALTQRVYPQWAPLSPAASNTWQGFEAEVCQRAEAVFTYSEFARQSVIRDYGCPPERVVAIGAGANQQLASLEGRHYDRRRALFVGYDFERKGGRALLNAWHLVRDRVPDAELIIAGADRHPAPDAGNGVTWRGRVDRAELARLYRSADVFVLPSLFDPWGHVFVEAMGYGLPCIGCDCCAMPELIENGVSGRLVARTDPEPLAEALTELLTDPETAARMGRAGHARVREQLQWDHVIDRLVSHLGH